MRTKSLTAGTAFLSAALAIPVAARLPLPSVGASAQGARSATGAKDPAAGPAIEFVLGTATPSEACAQCHEEIYRETAFGFGADLQSPFDV